MNLEQWNRFWSWLAGITGVSDAPLGASSRPVASAGPSVDPRAIRDNDDSAQAEALFLAGPMAFLQENIIQPNLFRGFADNVQLFRLIYDPNVDARKGKFKPNRKRFPLYKVEPDESGLVRAYVLGFRKNDSVGLILGCEKNDPNIMFTYRMDGCSFGFYQADGKNPCYVSHHNDIIGDNSQITIENQKVSFSDDSKPNLTYFHAKDYMSDSKNKLYLQYKATLVGMRDGDGIWRFFIQIRKFHKVADRDLSFKKLLPLNPSPAMLT
jgi:hypothetical protein